MEKMISNCCEAEVMLSVGLIQFVVPSKFIYSGMCPEMSV